MNNEKFVRIEIDTELNKKYINTLALLWGLQKLIYI